MMSEHVNDINIDTELNARLTLSGETPVGLEIRDEFGRVYLSRREALILHKFITDSFLGER